VAVQRNTAPDTPAFGLLTVDGPSGYIQDVTVTLFGLTLAGGDSSVFGGGISNSANLTVMNCTITGNTASPRGGVASARAFCELGFACTLIESQWKHLHSRRRKCSAR
jgi:hypothetical protein